MPLLCDICVIGGGPGGLTAAVAAASFGEKVVLIESGEMGGDCLNAGCVPSKSLIAAARRAHAVRQARGLGVLAEMSGVDFARVSGRVHSVIGAIAPRDSQARLESLGVRVIRVSAIFLDPQTVLAGDERITARRYVIATGSSPLAPPIPGLEAVDYLTNETIFDLGILPDHLMVIGGGPMGLELAQAHRRLGAMVTVIEARTCLGGEDPELSQIVLDQLAADGVNVIAPAEVAAVSRTPVGRLRLSIEAADGAQAIEGSHLLVAAGRTPNVDSLDLARAGVAASKSGIVVDRCFRTSNRRVYAIGDVTDGPRFTHAADHEAGLVIRDALFRLPPPRHDQAMPRVTYTDPEIAQVGLTEGEARALGGEVRVLRSFFDVNDRAEIEGSKQGLVKVVTGPRGRTLGAGIVGPNAGDLILPWCLAISRRLPIRAMAELVVPYPTLGEASRRAALSYYAELPAKPWVRSLVRMLKWLD